MGCNNQFPMKRVFALLCIAGSLTLPLADASRIRSAVQNYGTVATSTAPTTYAAPVANVSSYNAPCVHTAHNYNAVAGYTECNGRVRQVRPYRRAYAPAAQNPYQRGTSRMAYTHGGQQLTNHNVIGWENSSYALNPDQYRYGRTVTQLSAAEKAAKYAVQENRGAPSHGVRYLPTGYAEQIQSGSRGAYVPTPQPIRRTVVVFD